MGKSIPPGRKKKKSAGSSWWPIAAGGGALVVGGILLVIVLQSRRTTSKEPPSPSPATIAATTKPVTPSGDAAKELADAVAEADRLDPGWRTQELEAKRPKPPLGRDSVVYMMAVEKQRELNKYHTTLSETLQSIEDVPSNVPLTPDQVQRLLADLRPLAPVLNDAQRVIELPEGFHVLQYAPDGVSTLLPTVQAPRQVVRILQAEAILQAQNKKSPDAAAASVRGMLNAAHTFADMPTTIAQLVRIVMDGVAVRTLQRVLAQCQPSDSALAAIQKQVEAEAAAPLLLVAARSERALLNDFMTAGAAGKVNPELVKQLAETRQSKDKTLPDTSAAAYQAAHPWLLHYFTKMVEISKTPLEKQAETLKQLAATVANAPPLAQFLAAELDTPFKGFRANAAILRCTAAALAAERYRLQKGTWPASLSALVDAKLLGEVPVDPFDGASLRFGRLKDGLVIYSVGVDGKDNAGDIDNKNRDRAGADLGFRLWDLPQRGQAAR